MQITKFKLPAWACSSVAAMGMRPESTTTVAEFAAAVNGLNAQIKVLERQNAAAREDLMKYQQQVEQLQVQLAGCAVAAKNGSEEQEAPVQSYGWSPVYADVLLLRRTHDQLLSEFVDLQARKGKRRKTKIRATPPLKVKKMKRAYKKRTPRAEPAAEPESAEPATVDLRNDPAVQKPIAIFKGGEPARTATGKKPSTLAGAMKLEIALKPKFTREELKETILAKYGAEEFVKTASSSAFDANLSYWAAKEKLERSGMGPQASYKMIDKQFFSNVEN